MEVRYNTTLGVRLSRQDADKLRLCAARSHMTPSSFIRKVLLDYVDKAFPEEKVSFSLPSDVKCVSN